MGGWFSRQERYGLPTSPLLTIPTLIKKPLKIIMFSLEHTGRELLIPHFGLNQPTTLTIPMIGINIQAIELKSRQLVFYSWDITDASRTSRFWRGVKAFMEGFDVLVFVVDSTDRDGLTEARDQLKYYLSLTQAASEKGEEVLLIVATKGMYRYQQAMDVSEIRDAFEIVLVEGGRRKNRKWRVQGCDATTGKGLDEGLEWVAAQLSGV